MACKLAELADLCLIEFYLLAQTQVAQPPSVKFLGQKVGVVDATRNQELTAHLEVNGWVEVLNRSTADRTQFQLTIFGTTTAVASGLTGAIQQSNA